MDPHKRSATIEVMTGDETVRGGGRFGTDRTGYAAMIAYAKQWPDRVWAIEGCQGIGRHIATRLLTDGEQVLDVPPKLSARARVFATGQGRRSRSCRSGTVPRCSSGSRQPATRTRTRSGTGRGDQHR
jgi:hypothetical protein